MCISSEPCVGLIDTTAVVQHFLSPAAVEIKERVVCIFGILLVLDLMKGMFIAASDMRQYLNIE